MKNPFEKKVPSMGEFKDAKEYAKQEKKEAEFAGSLTHLESPVARQEIYDKLWTSSAKADNHLRKLYNKREKGATILNEKYEKLKLKVKEAVEELTHFEQEELGIEENTEE